MRIDPHEHATRLLGAVGADQRATLAANPAATVADLFEIEVAFRPPSPPIAGCAIDGTYHPGPPPRILIADDATPARQRFTVLHELGHHLVEHDDILNDLEIDDAERRDEEICNEVAASILLPDGLVAGTLPAGVFTARDVSLLHDLTNASRMACCVAALRRMRHPGCVILGGPDGTALFIAHKLATPWRIARHTPQGDDSLLVRAGTAGHARGTTRVRFASGAVSGAVHGDAFMADDGWVFEVVVVDSHSPWNSENLNLGLAYTGPDGTQIECANCGEAATVFAAPCPRCGDPRCPSCGRCSCAPGPAPHVCSVCFVSKAPNLFEDDSTVCIDCF